MKASEILLDDTIPHGTREGYAAGCHGSHCPGKEKLGQSCSQANIRYASDYSYKRRIDGGLSPEAIWAEDQLDGVVPPKRVDADTRNDAHTVPSVTVADSETPVGPTFEEVHDAVKAAAIAHAESTGIAYEKHGTTAGYSAGCRDKTGCPGLERVYKSCTQAVAEYQRSLKERKRAEQGLIAPKGKPEAGEEVVEAAVERRVDDVAAELHQARIDLAEVTRQRDDAAAQSDSLLEAQAGHVGRINELESLVSDRDAELLDARGTIARLQEQLVTSVLELDVAKVPAAAAVPAAAVGMAFAIEQVGSALRVQMDGSSEPMRLELGFENGQLQRAAVVTGA